MLVKQIEENYPLVYQCLMHIAACDDTGPIDGSRKLPDTYKNFHIGEFFEHFDNWLGQFENKKTGDIICPDDFKNYLNWSDNDWNLYTDHNEWECIYSKDNAIESFASSESCVMDIIELKYHGEIYSDFLVDSFNGDISIFSGFTPLSP